MSTGHRSIVGSPSTIHSASAPPAPPALAMPAELKPAPTKKFFRSGASPRMKLPSGVKLSGPLTNCLIGAVSNRSEEHTSELQSLMRISYAVFCLKKKKQTYDIQYPYYP